MSCLKSFGAAHWLAQWARWKTIQSVRDDKALLVVHILTLLNAVLGSFAVLFLLGSDTFHTVVVVVLVGSALLRSGAFC